jgi:hypothetical protein
MIDVTAKPRPKRDIELAIECFRSEVVKNPMAMSKDGQPLIMHYLVACDAMRELLALRGEEGGEAL